VTPIGRELPADPEPGPGLRTEYRSWLDAIDDELVGGALIVVEAMPRVTRGFLAGDDGTVADATARSEDIAERCRRVEEQGFVLLAREAPVSGDLRRLVAILRLVHDVERSGRLMRHIAESVERIDPLRLPSPLRRQLGELAARSLEVYRRGVDAWRHRDGLAVHELDGLDADVDRLRTGLLVRAGELDGAGTDVLVLGLLARYYERLADHGVAFAQHVTFVVTGQRVDVGP
jgi:phosphate transport system protein